MDGGDEVDALIDLTGGVHEIQKRNSNKNEGGVFVKGNKLWNIIFKSFSLRSLCGSSIDVRENQRQEHVESNGLALGHAYSVLNAVELIYDGETYSRNREPLEELDPSVETVKLLKFVFSLSLYIFILLCINKMINKSFKVKKPVGSKKELDRRMVVQFERMAENLR